MTLAALNKNFGIVLVASVCIVWRGVPVVTFLRTSAGIVMCKKWQGSLDGRVALVTGGGSGMGLEAARTLASRGARVILASRNATKLQRARDQLRASTGNPRVEYRVFDLASLDSVRGLAADLAQEPRLDMLVNNAGEIGLPDVHTADSLSLMMQVNFFSPFLLTYLLFPLLRRSKPSRIVATGAMTMYFGDIDFDHWNDLGRYNYLTASGNAKLAVFLISAEWARRAKDMGVTSNTVDPFVTKDTDIAKRIYGQLVGLFNRIAPLQPLLELGYTLLGADPKTLGQELAYYASAPEMANVTGEYLSFCRKLPPHWILQNMKLRRKLWKEAKRMVQIRPEEEWDAHLDF